MVWEIHSQLSKCTRNVQGLQGPSLLVLGSHWDRESREKGHHELSPKNLKPDVKGEAVAVGLGQRGVNLAGVPRAIHPVYP